MTKQYPITPVSKPRQTRRDKWLNPPRKSVQKYRWFKDLVRSYQVELPLSNAHVTFVLPMPKSWSKKKRAKMDGKPHQSKKDVDNLLKSLLDAVYEDDSCVWDVRVTKVWGKEGGIEIETI